VIQPDGGIFPPWCPRCGAKLKTPVEIDAPHVEEPIRPPVESESPAVSPQITLETLQYTMQLLNQGSSPEETQHKLMETGLDAQSAAQVVVFAQDRLSAKTGNVKATVLQLVGGAVFALGIGLLIGNITGLFRTFPFAGYLTMAVGGAIYGAGQRASH
jgi:hypothetical protein